MVEKYLLLCNAELACSISGKGYVSSCVTAFSALKSTQNLYFGLPSNEFLGTKIAGALQGELLSSITPFSTCPETDFLFPS
jgi:hypothetical protein